ncbi:Uncharacterized protein Fot_00602 [Forsythia ovata]|uniref:Uncharacterized protein n=1 Tax=Forsythia ovata TaxID=205694 RepID=A0ABD1X4L5_9LAMI
MQLANQKDTKTCAIKHLRLHRPTKILPAAVSEQFPDLQKTNIGMLDARDLYSKSSPINGSNRNVHSPRPNDHIRWAHRNSGDTLFRLGIFLSLFLLNAVQSQSTVASIDHHLTGMATSD